MLCPEVFVTIVVLYVPVEMGKLFLVKVQLLELKFSDCVTPEFNGVNGFSGPGAASVLVSIQLQFPVMSADFIASFLQLWIVAKEKNKIDNLINVCLIDLLFPT